MESIDELTLPWLGNGATLARQILAYADQLENPRWPERFEIAVNLRAIIRCDHNLLPPVRPQLGVPPKVRPAVPRPEPGSP